MNPNRAELDSLLAKKRAEWSATLLRHNPRLRQPLQNALQILARQNVQSLDSCNLYRVHGNPHDYCVNLAARECSCRKTNCEHFLAAWFAFSQEEFVREQMERVETDGLNESVSGVWQGINEHICADGFCETATFGYGDEIRCARCDALYVTACDETI